MTFARSLLLSIFFLLPSLLIDAQLQPQESFAEIIKQAEIARNANRVTDAIGLYRRAVQLRPSWSDGWLWLGDLLYEQERFPEAQDSFAQYVTLMPAPGPVWAMKALCEFETRDYALSRKDLDIWIQGGLQGSQPLTEVAAFHEALLLTRERHFDQALALLSDRARRRGESPLLVEALGLASLHLPQLPGEYSPELREQVWLAGKAMFYLSVKEFERGQDYSHRLMVEYGQQPEVHYIHGLLLKAQSKSDEAAQEFHEELKVYPQNSQAMQELAQVDHEISTRVKRKR